MLRSPTMPGEADGPAPIEALLQQHLPRLRAFVRLRTNEAIRARESCSDLVQSVCRELLEENRFEFRGEAQFRNWLYTAALRKIVARDRHWHAQARDVARELSPAAAESGAAPALLDAYATVSTPSVHLERKESEAAFEAAFASLSAEHQEVVSLVKLVGLSHAEVATQLGKTEEACRQLLRRALIKLEIELDRRSHGAPDGAPRPGEGRDPRP